MSAKVETLYRGETSQLEHRVAILEKLTPAHQRVEFLSVSARPPWSRGGR